MIQIHNRLYDQMNATGGIAALLAWDSTIFDNMVLPDGVELSQVVNVLLMRDGDRPLTHPSPEWMKVNIEVWSRFMCPIWEKLIATTMYDYNPIHNYDRTETHEDTRTVTRNRVVSLEEEGTTDLSGNTTTDNKDTNEVSAENASSYQPESQTTSEGTATNSQNTSTTNKSDTSDEETENEGYTHSVHAEGNIGVTTTQQMIQAEREVVRFSIYDVIESDFVQEFCLRIW